MIVLLLAGKVKALLSTRNLLVIRITVAKKSSKSLECCGSLEEFIAISIQRHMSPLLSLSVFNCERKTVELGNILSSVTTLMNSFPPEGYAVFRTMNGVILLGPRESGAEL
jgi:hypothetical protein